MLLWKGKCGGWIGDGGPKLAKLRPMRVEMYGMNWNGWLGKILPRSPLYRHCMQRLYATAKTSFNSFHAL